MLATRKLKSEALKSILRLSLCAIAGYTEPRCFRFITGQTQSTARFLKALRVPNWVDPFL